MSRFAMNVFCLYNTVVAISDLSSLACAFIKGDYIKLGYLRLIGYRLLSLFKSR